MSELIEELLNDDTDDFPDIGEAEEDALLQDDEDGDVLKLVPEEELGETGETDQKNGTDAEEKRGSRQDKFATERQKITAPESSERIHNNRPGRPNQRGRGRGARQQMGRYQQFNQGRQYNNGGQLGRNKTVLINPRFQGVVHVNNNARLAWDTQQQQFQPNPWTAGGPSANMGPPIHAQIPPHHQMQHAQGPPQMQFQSPMQQFQGPPQMQAFQGQHMQPGQQMQFISPHQGFMPQPLPPGVPQQSPMQPPNLPNQPSYWDQNQFTAPQGPHQQMNPYMQNNFESPQPVIINTAQPPPQMQAQNYHYNNQFYNNGPPMQQQQQNYMQQNRKVYAPNNVAPQSNRAPIKREMFSPKRKAPFGTFAQNKKRFVHDRLGTVEQPLVEVKSIAIKSEDRPSVVKEVTVTNVTTVKIEEDDETRDLRRKIEEQKRQRAQIIQWKELRRLENLKEIKIQNAQQQPNPQAIKLVRHRVIQGQGKGRGGYQQQNRMQQQHIGGSVRKPVLQPIKQIDEQRQFKGRGRNQKFAKTVNNRVITVPTAAAPPVVQVEEPVVQLDEKHMSTFLADRKVLVKDEALMSTRKVVIKNIATSTGNKKIIQICKSIGEVQKLHRDKNDPHATITFKSVASAHAFFKKYQRHMLDLSMIEVSLTPEESAGNEAMK